MSQGVLTYVNTRRETVLADVAHVTPRMEDFMLRDARLEDRLRLARTFARMTLGERRLLAGATRAQRAIGWGCYGWLRYTPTPGAPLWQPCTIYGRIYSEIELRAAEAGAERTLREQGFGPVPAEHTIATVLSAYRVGWRYGMWYSEIEPYGEAGSNHIAHLAPMTRVQFGQARRLGWPEIPPWM